MKQNLDTTSRHPSNPELKDFTAGNSLGLRSTTITVVSLWKYCLGPVKANRHYRKRKKRTNSSSNCNDWILPKGHKIYRTNANIITYHTQTRLEKICKLTNNTTSRILAMCGNPRTNRNRTDYNGSKIHCTGHRSRSKWQQMHVTDCDQSITRQSEVWQESLDCVVWHHH